jgi:hypothetical protein
VLPRKERKRERKEKEGEQGRGGRGGGSGEREEETKLLFEKRGYATKKEKGKRGGRERKRES